ncbi:MAG: AMP-binding protein [Bacteroidales bacterium]|nr:AMP-binding protein [Candidatus Cacconaster merdequi]
MKNYFTTLEKEYSESWFRKAVCDYDGESFTFGQLAYHIERFHIIFSKAGIMKGDRIVICAGNSARWAAAFLASATYGAVVVPILPDITPENTEKQIANCQGRILFTDNGIYRRLDISGLPSIEGVVSCSDFSLLFSRSRMLEDAFNNIYIDFNARHPGNFTADDIHYPTDNLNDIALLHYALESESDQMVIRHESICAAIDYGTDGPECNRKETAVSMLPMGNIQGLIFGFLYPLCNGKTVYLMDSTPSPTVLLNAMKSVRPYMVCTIPSVIENIYLSSIKPSLEKKHIKTLLHTPLMNKIVHRSVRRRLVRSLGGRVRIFILLPRNNDIMCIFAETDTLCKTF